MAATTTSSCMISSIAAGNSGQRSFEKRADAMDPSGGFRGGSLKDGWFMLENPLGCASQ